jgi:L-alanine-DL-glutamate epimerase-like enolase superfamily enzyme
VDANQGWSYAQALRTGDALIELGVDAIEEPIPAADREGRRRLAMRWRVPMIGDESCISLSHVAGSLDDGAIRTVSVKTARTGFTESRRILGHCLARAIPVVVGSQYEGAVGVLATAAFAPAFAATAGRAAEVMSYTDLGDDLLAEPLVIRDGRLVPPAAPGLGIEIDEEKLAHYRLHERGALAPV